MINCNIIVNIPVMKRKLNVIKCEYDKTSKTVRLIDDRNIDFLIGVSDIDVMVEAKINYKDKAIEKKFKMMGKRK